MSFPRLPVEEILDQPPALEPGRVIGRSRENRPLHGVHLGTGPINVSLIGGCHADEPVGPEMLARLVSFLDQAGSAEGLLAAASWTIVPHVNPDGARRNLAWSERRLSVPDHRGSADTGFDVVAYARHVVREPPGDDIEFGFPRHRDDTGARPENLAVADLLRRSAPFHLHGSFHGMGFAPGPWFLIERAWIDRTLPLREELRHRVGEMGYSLLDWDRRGDKGFEGIDEGFSTRPDSESMTRHFLDRGDEATAALFRPSSMELVRSLGGDPLTFVSEMPLFLHPDPALITGDRQRLRRLLDDIGSPDRPEPVEELLRREHLRPMPIRDQMRLQLAFLQAGLDAL